MFLSIRRVLFYLFLAVLFPLTGAQAQGLVGTIVSEEAGEPETNLLNLANEPWTGSLEEMAERGFVRILTAYNPLFFSFDGPERRGLMVEISEHFQESLRKRLKPKLGRWANLVDVVLIPVPRDQLIPRLLNGQGDIIAANLTITEERSKKVAFSNPILTDVSEVLITGPDVPQISRIGKLFKTGIHVRKSSSYYEHLVDLNEYRWKHGLPQIPIHFVNERLEDFSVLELVDSGIIPAMIMDSHKADFWGQVYTKAKIRSDITINDGGETAWAVRPENTDLLEEINHFTKTYSQGTLLGNIMLDRYLGDAGWVEDVLKLRQDHKFRELASIMKSYAEDYGFDWLKIFAQAYQESQLDHSRKSHKGALGVMQVLPSTAKDPNVAIENIDTLEGNVHAGVKYLHFLREKYFSGENFDPVDQTLLALAAYNAGPAALERARRRTERMGLDPNVWFGNVEVGAARSISYEPVHYVRNIFKYYVAFRMLGDLIE